MAQLILTPEVQLFNPRLRNTCLFSPQSRASQKSQLLTNVFFCKQQHHQKNTKLLTYIHAN